MATCDKIKNGKNGSKSVEAEEFAKFLQSKKMDSISLILLDIFSPFERISRVMLPIFEPLAALLFGENFAKKMDAFSMQENSFDALKKALERGQNE